MRISFRLSALLAPGLLLAVAGLQGVLVRTHHLTPWKGGGFGMFSTFDRTEARALHVVLETAEGEARVFRPRITVPKARALNMPSDGVLRDAAVRALDTEWRLFTPDDFAALRPHLSPAYRRQLDRGAQPPDMLLALDARALPAGLTGHPAHLRAARADVWRQRFDPATHAVTAERVASVRVPVR